MPAPTEPAHRRDSPVAIFLRFLRFGALAWGGPAAQIAMIKHECVDEEGWVDQATFKKTLAVYQVLPGPEAHELCVYFGRLRAGRLGGLLAGLGFMLPGFLLMLGLSILYVEAELSDNLDEHERLILALRYVDGRPVGEIARTLGVPVGTAKSRLHFARRSLEHSYNPNRPNTRSGAS